MSRSDRPISDRYPELAGPGRAVPVQAVLDGEIVAFDPGTGRPSFSLLQHRMQAATLTPALLAAAPVTYLAFDLLHAGAESLLARPYAERRARLESLQLAGPTWQTPPAWVGAGADGSRPPSSTAWKAWSPSG